MFGDLLDLDFTDLASYADFDWDALFSALGDLSAEDLGGLFIDLDTGEVVDAATAAAAGLGDFDPTLLDEAGADLEIPDLVQEPPIYLEEAEAGLGHLTPLEAVSGIDPYNELAETGMGHATPEQIAATAPFNADSGFDWSKLLRAAGAGLSGLAGAGGPLAKMLAEGGGSRVSPPPGMSFGEGGSPSVGVPRIGGEMGLGASPSLAAALGQPSSGGIPRVSEPMAGASVPGSAFEAGASVPGVSAPSGYVRDPITGALVPAQTPPPGQSVPLLQVNPFQPLIVPSNGGGQIPMATPIPQRISGLQRLLMER